MKDAMEEALDTVIDLSERVMLAQFLRSKGIIWITEQVDYKEFKKLVEQEQ